MKKVFMLILVIALSLFLSACKMRVTEGNDGDLPDSTRESDTLDNVKIYQWNNEISFPFPAPKAEAYEISDLDGVYCRGTTKAGLDDYLVVLKGDGWEVLDNTPEGGSQSVYFILIKENMVINITDQTMVDENHIRISFSSGYSKAGSDGRLSKAEAEKLIQEYINSLTHENQFGYGKIIYRLVELDIEDSFEKMGLQAFSAYDKTGQINNYLICRGSVCEAPFLGDTLVADIDKDNSYELLSVCGWGSGIYRIEIKAYKYGKPAHSNSMNKVLFPAYYNCYVPKNGYAELMLEKASDTEVKLYGAVREKGRLVPKTDYGVLKINGLRLYTDAPDFPFKEMSTVPVK